MVTPAADPSSNQQSPTSAATTSASADTVAVNVTNSPTFARRSLPSPWAQVVRGPDSEPPSAPSSSFSAADQQAPLSGRSPPVENSNSDGTAAVAAVVDSSEADKDNNNNASDHPKKAAWKRPSNGVADSGAALNVMGALSWPALSDSTKPSFKSTPQSASSSSNKIASDGSLPTPLGPVTPHSPQKHAATNVKPNTGHGAANRQRTMKRVGGNGNRIGHGHAQSSFSAPPPPPSPPPFPVFQIPASPRAFPNGIPGVLDPSQRNPYRDNNWVPVPPFGGFMPPMVEQRSPSRRGNFGHHPHNGSYHNNNGNRRDQDRGNYHHARDAQDRRNHQHARDAHLHLPRPYMSPLPPNTPPAPIIGPQPMRPITHPAVFPQYPYFPTSQFESFGGMPFFTHGPHPAMFFPVAKTPLTNMIVNQIDYYFSDANLVKDQFLRSNMDEQGWVPITLIASFPRVKSLTSNVEVILDSMRTSTMVEVEDDRLRRRNDWMKWLPSGPRRADYGSISPGGSSSNNPTADFEKITLKDATVERVISDPTTANGDSDDVTGEPCIQSELPNGDATGSSN